MQIDVGGEADAGRDDRPGSIATPVITVFADTCCPFTHVGLRRLVARRDAEQPEFRLYVRAWPLELVNGEPLRADLIAEEVGELREQVDRDAFARFDASRFPPTSLPSLALAAAAYERGLAVGEQVSLALRHALFEEGRDIADPAVLAAVAAAHGLEPPATRHVAAVRSDWEEGRRLGVKGSPHFFAGTSSFFCPVLVIRRVEGRLRISADESGLDALVAASRHST